jgi:hypothetical protein
MECIYGDMKKIYFRVTLVKIMPSARARAAGKMPAESGWASFFGYFVRVIELHFDL